jgi:hypothetical protein
MRAACCATGFSTGPIPGQPCGPTQPIARGGTRRSWRERLHQSRPSQEASRPPDAHADPPRQRPQVCRAFANRARLRRAEGPNEPLHPHHRNRSSTHQDRARQSRLQHKALHLVGENCDGDIEGRRILLTTLTRLQTNVPQRASKSPQLTPPTPSERGNRGVQLLLS